MGLPRQLVLATTNAHKLRECQAILAPLGVQVVAPAQPLEVEETGADFAANALLKAQHLAQQSGGVALADDSGLEVDGLGGAPGVYSARYAARAGAALPAAIAALGSVDAQNRALLLHALRTGGGARRARFVCALVLYAGPADVHTFMGTVSGHIAEQEHGADGFGYDPVFVPDGHSCTFAQMPAAQKNALSHRAEALAQLVAHLRGA